MATISTAIELVDNFSGIMNNIINCVNLSVSTMEEMQSTMNEPIDTASLQGMRDRIDQATIAAQELVAAMHNMEAPDTSSSAPVRIPVEAVVPDPLVEQPAPVEVPIQWQTYGGLEVFTNTGIERFEQEVASVNSMLERLNDTQYRITQQANGSEILPPEAAYDIQNVENRVQELREMMEQVENNPLNMGTDTANSQLERLREQLNDTLALQDNLNQAMQGMDIGEINAAYLRLSQNISDAERLVRDSFFNIPPVEIPVTWNADTLEVFMGTGMERFQQEVQSTNSMLEQLSRAQDAIARQAYNTNIFPPQAAQDLNNLSVRIDTVRDRIQQIENNPLNMGTDAANAELEQLRAQLDQAIQEQQNLNNAVENMDVPAANEAYLRLSQIVGNTERHIRDNVDEQGRFNNEIQEGVDLAGNLKGMIAGAIGAFAGIAGIRKAFSFVQDCTETFNTQLNSETQLISVLANMLDEDYVAQFELETSADTTGAVDEINAIQNAVDEVVVPVTAKTKALTAAYEEITAKAAEIQSRGIYGDEIMIGAAAEFSTYFTDTDAIEMMMDTLTNYAMGMSGGGEIDATGMVNYATNLGKIMSGSYDAMTKKGFEFTDAQKAIIEGEATREQIVAALGEEYVAMSADMQAAAAITQVIDEAWAGLYESMSNTPEGRIIQLNNAWGDMKEVIGGQLYPYVLLFVDAIENNWGTIEEVVQTITIGLEYMLGVLPWLMEGAINFAQVIIDNWGWISPIIYGIAGALAIYYGWQFSVNAINLISKAIHIAMAAAQMMQAAATGALTAETAAEIAAQNGLNAAMYACPIAWIIVLIIALIALFYAAVAAVNKFAGTSVSATGIICGVFMVAAAFIGNLFVTLINFVIDIFVVLWNFIAAFANFFGNVFHDPVGAIARLFFDLVDTILSLLESLASAIDTIFGSNLSGAVSGWRNSLSGWVDETFGQGEEIMAKMDASSMHLERFEYGAAWDAGYSFGEGIDESIANFDPSSLFGTTDIPSADDFAGALTSGGMGSSVDDIAGNTGDIADSLDITEEDLKYLRDIAEQETINRFTTAEIKVDMGGITNHVSSDTDLDGMINHLTEVLEEQMAISAEGVH